MSPSTSPGSSSTTRTVISLLISRSSSARGVGCLKRSDYVSGTTPSSSAHAQPGARHWSGERASDEPAGRGGEPLPAPARPQPGGLVPVGSGGPGTRPRRGPAHPALDRLRGLPLVSRDGAGVLRGPRDGRPHERALRLDQGGPRGAPGPRLHLHGRRAGDERPRWLAADGLPDAGRRAVLCRDLLSAGAAPRDAGVPAGPHRHRRGMARSPRGGDAAGDHGSSSTSRVRRS